MRRLRYCPKSLSLRQAEQGMALVFAKQANTEIGDFGRNPLGARAILFPDIVVTRSCGLTTFRSSRRLWKQNSHERNLLITCSEVP